MSTQRLTPALQARYETACRACDAAEARVEAARKRLDDAVETRRIAAMTLGFVQDEMDAALDLDESGHTRACNNAARGFAAARADDDAECMEAYHRALERERRTCPECRPVGIEVRRG